MLPIPRLSIACAAILLLVLGCEPTTSPSPPPAPPHPEDSISGFVPMAVGNSWKYSFRSTQMNGHNGSGYIDSGFRLVTLTSRQDSSGIGLFTVEVTDTIYSRAIIFNWPSAGVTQSFREIQARVVEDSSHVWLLSTQEDIDGMLTACFMGHAYPADSTRKVAASAFATPGLPDSIWVAHESGPSAPGDFLQAQGIGMLEYAGSIGGSFNSDGSITPGMSSQYRLMEFRLTHQPAQAIKPSRAAPTSASRGRATPACRKAW